MKETIYILAAIVVVAVLVIIIPKASQAPEIVTDETVLSTTTATTTITAVTNTPPAPQVPAKTVVKQTWVPVVKATTTIGMNQTATLNGIQITAARMRDYRDKGGEARTLLKVKGPITSKNVDLFAGQGFVVDGMLVTLVQVLPEYKKNKTIAESDYRFTITVEPK